MATREEEGKEESVGAPGALAIVSDDDGKYASDAKFFRSTTPSSLPFLSSIAAIVRMSRLLYINITDTDTDRYDVLAIVCIVRAIRTLSCCPTDLHENQHEPCLPASGFVAF